MDYYSYTNDGNENRVSSYSLLQRSPVVPTGKPFTPDRVSLALGPIYVAMLRPCCSLAKSSNTPSLSVVNSSR